MAATNISRSGTFDTGKLPILEGQLRSAGLPTPMGVYGTDTGLRANWPNGLTAPQTTQATTIINAYVEPSDLSQLNTLQLQAYNYLQIPSPTVAQSQAALRQVIKVLLRISTGKEDLDGFDLTF